MSTPKLKHKWNSMLAVLSEYFGIMKFGIILTKNSVPFVDCLM